MRFITDRIRVFLFGIVIAVLGLISPSRAVRSAYNALNSRS